MQRFLFLFLFVTGFHPKEECCYRMRSGQEVTLWNLSISLPDRTHPCFIFLTKNNEDLVWWYDWHLAWPVWKALLYPKWNAQVLILHHSYQTTYFSHDKWKPASPMSVLYITMFQHEVFFTMAHFVMETAHTQW